MTLATFVAKNYRFLSRDPSFFWMTIAARFEPVREWATRPSEECSDIAINSQLVRATHDTEMVVETLRTEGYYAGLTLAPEATSELMACARRNVCYGDRNADLGFYIDDRAAFEKQLGRKLKLASHFNQQLDWPVFRRIKDDPWLNAVAGAYLGCEPVFLRSELLWSFSTAATPEERLNNAQRLHCDINDYKALNIFFYLTDVDAYNGPHQYIKRGKVKRTLMHQMLGQRVSSISEETLLRTYGRDQLVTICGPAGTGFMGDTYNLHRGAHPDEGTRVMLRLEFGCRKYRTWYFDV